MPVRLWGSQNCDFTGLADYRNGVFDILYDSATGYSKQGKYRLGLDDTLTFSGGASDMSNIVENMATLLDGRVQVPALTIGSGNSITAFKTDTVAWNVGSLDDGQSAVALIAITGVDSTNWVAFAALTSLDASGWSLVAYPVAGVVYVTLTNHTGGTLNPADGVLRVVAMKVA